MQVQITLLDIDKLAPQEAELSAVLSPDETARAERLHFARDRTRFRLGRAALRHLLAQHGAPAAEELRFTYGPHGKPALEGQPHAFNASGAGGLVAVALGSGGSLGVDVERPRSRSDWRAITRRFFAPLEQDEIFDLPEECQEDAFLRTLTLKEAVIKFTGRGLGQGLESFAVSMKGDSGPRLAAWSGELRPPGALWTQALSGGAHLSLACDGPELAVVGGEVPPLLKRAAVRSLAS